MKEIICPKCGKSNPADAEFCSNCITLLKDRNAKDPEPQESDSPEWLKKIRERSQSELPPTPPLGEYGEIESRQFDAEGSSDDIPEWLRDIQKNSPQTPAEPEKPESDWVSRLHEILPSSRQNNGQSTAFFSEDELAARAAAERQSSSEDFLPTDHAPTQPVDVPLETPSDFLFHSSEEQIDPRVESEFIDSLNGLGIPGESEPASLVPMEPELVPEQPVDSEELVPQVTSTGEPEESELVNLPPRSDEARSEAMGEEVQRSSTPGDIPLSGEILVENASDSLEMPKVSEELVTNLEKPDNTDLPDKKSSFFGLFGKKEEAKLHEEIDEKPEKLIPEGVLQPQYDRSVEYSGRLAISDSQRASISLLKNMLLGELQPQSPVPSTGKFSGKAIRLIIGMVLLVAMLVPLITGYTFVGEQALFSPGVVAMHTAISTLPENTPFLVITDYEPAFSGELRESATGVIDHLMKMGMNFSILSTIPSGTALAHDLFDSIHPGTFAYQPEKLAFLGYLPGGNTGLRDFVRNPREAMPLMEDGQYAWTSPATQSIFSIEDYSGVLIITENTETGRAWIEQLHGSMTGKPVLFVVSAQSAPLMRPYLDSEQANGLIGGRVEGAMYDRILESPPRSQSIMAAYQAGMVLAAAMMLFGGFYGILLGLFSRNDTSSTEDFHVS
ncbi:MAG: zinc ribbon domain-containing protein [Leptolinea sp.]|nr:zinc ribbon domain-containing protein [Leptolinea sp.]